MAKERTPRAKATHPDIDLRKPVDSKKLMTEATEEDCYTYLWKPDSRLCAVCADLEICGILFNKRQGSLVRKREKEKGGYLDMVDFEGIDRKEVVKWLALKPRTTQTLIDKIKILSNCPDDDTVIFWCKSFIMETKGVSTKNGVVIIK